MTSGSNRPDDGLGERLRELDAPEGTQNGELMDRMFTDMKARCDKNDRTMRGFLRSRSTMARRLIVLTVFSALAIAGWFAFPMVGDQARTVQWTASLVTFCVLLVLAMFMVTRPVHLPALPRWQSMCLACIAVGATVLAAFWPHPAALAATHDHTGGTMVGACMGARTSARQFQSMRCFVSWIAGTRSEASSQQPPRALPGTSCSKRTARFRALRTSFWGTRRSRSVFVVGLGLVHRWIPSK